MEFLNIGIPELVFILLLMLILLGPEGMVKTARTIAKEARKIIRSPLWKDLLKAQQEIQDLPTSLLRQAGIDELQGDLRKASQEARAELNAVYAQSVIRPPDSDTQVPVEVVSQSEELDQDEIQALPPGSEPPKDLP